MTVLICMTKTIKSRYDINMFDAFCRTITFTNPLFNKGQVRPQT